MSAPGKVEVPQEAQSDLQQGGAEGAVGNVDVRAQAGASAGLGPGAVSGRPGGAAAEGDPGGLVHLEELRAELDATDAALLEAIRQRLDVCARIGLHKKRFTIPMMQPQRIGVVQARAAAFAQAHGLRPEFLHALYVHIIEETCRLEEEIIGHA
jgi:chorismate mutase